MKLRIVVIIALLCSFHTICDIAARAKENYEIMKTDSTTNITIHGDFDIAIGSVVPVGYLIYGEKRPFGNDKFYGGEKDELFKRNQVDPNSSYNGVSIYREKASKTKGTYADLSKRNNDKGSFS